MYVYVSVSISWPVRKDSSRVCMGQEVGNLKESMHWHLHDGRPVLSAWRALLRQSPYYINTWAMVWPTDYPAVAL